MPVLDKERDPEALIQRCPQCPHCSLEVMLSPEQRKNKVLDVKLEQIPKDHAHRKLIEELCGRDYDDVCDMKYAFMRSKQDPRAIIQIKCIEIRQYDLGKEFPGAIISYEGACRDWVSSRNLGRGFFERPAERYAEIYMLGIWIFEDGTKKQMLSPEQIYGKVMARGGNYQKHLDSLKADQEDHNYRRDFGRGLNFRMVG